MFQHDAKEQVPRECVRSMDSEIKEEFDVVRAGLRNLDEGVRSVDERVGEVDVRLSAEIRARRKS